MKTLFPFILSALFPGLGQIYLRDYLKGVLMILIPIIIGMYIDLIPFMYPYLIALLWSLADIFIKTEKKESKKKAIISLLFSLLIVVIIIPSFFYLSIVSMTSGGDYFADEYLNKDRTKEEMMQIATALDKYNAHYKNYPTDYSEFINSKPIWADWESDDWNNEYKYTVTVDSTKYVLISAGKDQKFDTADDLIKK